MIQAFLETDGQRFHVAPGEAAVGDEAFHRHAADLYGTEQFFVVLEAAQAADVDQWILLGRHGQHIAEGIHFAHDVGNGGVAIGRVTLLDEPRIFGEAGRIDDDRYTVLAGQRSRGTHVAYGDRLAARTVAGDRDDQASDVAFFFFQGGC